MALFGKKKDINSEKQKSEMISAYGNYIKNNMTRICKVISDLEAETRVLVDHVSESEGKRLQKNEKKAITQEKEKIYQNLQYLYLIRDFFTALAKNASNVMVKNDELALVVKFVPYFDGVPVLEVDDEDEDQSILGIYKEILQMYKEIFISSKKSAKRFDFEEYLERYEEQIEEYIFPDIYSALDSFKNSINAQEKNDKTLNNTKKSASTNIEEKEVIVCPECGTKLVANAKFCLECGHKMEVSRPVFCSECGATLAPGVKFCSSCGNKVI